VEKQQIESEEEEAEDAICQH
jgi:hypothetical protein